MSDWSRQSSQWVSNDFAGLADLNNQQSDDTQGWGGVLSDALKNGIGNTIHTVRDMAVEAGRPSYVDPAEWQSKMNSAEGLEKYLGMNQSFGKTVADWGRKLEEDNAHSYSPGTAKRYASSMVASLPSMAALAAGAAGVARSGNVQSLGQTVENGLYRGSGLLQDALSNAPRIAGTIGKVTNKVAPALGETIIPGLAGGFVSAIPEAAMEKQNAVDDYVAEAKQNNTYVPGQTEREAVGIGDKVFNMNMGLLSGTNSAETMATFTKGSNVFPKSKAANILTRMIATMASEGLEEGSQQIIQKHAADKPWSVTDDDVKESALVGAMMGGIMHGGGRTATWLLDKKYKPSLQKEQSETETPAIQEETQIPQASISSGNNDIDSMINEAANKYGVSPDLIHAVMRTESTYNPNATSESGAQGLMQLMPATAEGLGVTNSYDPAQNIDGGTRYLRQLIDTFNGDTDKAIAAYNQGARTIEENGITEGGATYLNKVLGNLPIDNTQKAIDIPAQKFYNVTGEVSNTGLTDLTETKLNLLARDYYNQFGKQLDITSMKRDGDGSSWHDSGQAVDVVNDTLANDPEARAWLIEQGQKYGLTALDEYSNPSEHATGGHIHFSDHGEALAGGNSTQAESPRVSYPKLTDEQIEQRNQELQDALSTNDITPEHSAMILKMADDIANMPTGLDSKEDIAFSEALSKASDTHDLTSIAQLLPEETASILFPDKYGAAVNKNDFTNMLKHNVAGSRNTAIANIAKKGYIDLPKNKVSDFQKDPISKGFSAEPLADGVVRMRAPSYFLSEPAVRSLIPSGGSSDGSIQELSPNQQENANGLKKKDLLSNGLNVLGNVLNQTKSSNWKATPPDVQQRLNNFTGLQTPNIVMPTTQNDAGIQALQDLRSRQEPVEKPGFLKTAEDKVTENAFRSAINNQDYKTAADIASQSGNQRIADLMNNVVKQNEPREKTSAKTINDVSKLDHFKNSLTEEEALFFEFVDDEFQNTGNGFRDILNGLQVERENEIHEYVDILRGQMSQGVEKRSMTPSDLAESGYVFNPGFSKNYKWYQDMMAINGYKKMKKSDLENHLHETAIEHLSLGYIDPKYGVQVPENMVIQFQQREDAIHGIESIGSKAGEYEKFQSRISEESAKGDGKSKGNIREETLEFSKTLGEMLLHTAKQNGIRVNNDLKAGLKQNRPIAINTMKNRLEKAGVDPTALPKQQIQDEATKESQPIPVDKQIDVQPTQSETPAIKDTSSHSERFGSEDDALNDMLSAFGLEKPVSEKEKTFHVIDDSEDALNAALKEFSAEMKNLSANAMFNPKLMTAAFKVGMIHLQRGLNNFADWSKAMVASSEQTKPFLQSTWDAISAYPKDLKFNENQMSAVMRYVGTQYDKGITDKAELKAQLEKMIGSKYANLVDSAYAGVIKYPTKEEIENVNSNSADSVASRNGEGQHKNAMGETVSGRKSSGSGRQGIQSSNQAGVQPRSSMHLHGNSTTSSRTAGDSRIRTEESSDSKRSTGSTELSRSVRDSYEGEPISDGRGTGKGTTSSKSRPDYETIERATVKGNNKNFKAGDTKNIRDTLPLLLPEQQDDVVFAEKRLLNNEKNGVLFTNGTGTGKTFTGLGIIKRFAMQGKNNILILSPNDKINTEWQKAAKKYFSLKVSKLKDTKDQGNGIIVTTYANMGDNNQLVNRDWDLIVADESQSLMSGEKATPTHALDNLRAITYHDRGLFNRFKRLNEKAYAAVEKIDQDIKDMGEALKNSSNKTALESKLSLLKKKSKSLWDRLHKKQDKIIKDWANIPAYKKPKVTFLSATPFAYVPNIDYAEGYLFDYGKKESSRYNDPDGREHFMMENFGYRMRYNKLTRPEGNVDSSVMESQFHEKLRQSGALSGRMLTVDKDYDRGFILVDGGIGNKVDEGFEWLGDSKNGDYRDLYDYMQNSFKHHQRMYLLEAIKARGAVDLIKKYKDSGKKIVVFHDFKKGGAIHPFQRSNVPIELQAKYNEFASKRPDLIRMNLSDLKSPIVTLREAFGEDVLLFNGDVSKKDRENNVQLFNDDKSGKDIILVQSDAGQAGISLHDTTGEHQRVLINLGMPVKPVAAIQIEGRIYRVGQKSNAIFRYLNTGTNTERMAFASKIAERASTAENLALGNEARNLKDSFVNAFEDTLGTDEWKKNLPGSEGEGVGGKEKDKATRDALSEFDRSKTFYYGRGKKNAKTKSSEGKDYFATPEPLGYKMVEWANIQPGEKVLEPSAGHGAISRWFLTDTENTMIEPSQELAAFAQMSGNGKVLSNNFEDYYVGNKFDAIVMNPPFGSGGKTAIEHLAKAYKHLRDGGRIVAIIPDGPSCNKHFEKWFYGDENAKDKEGQSGAKDASLIKEIKLPNAVFERAGTKVGTKLLVIDKIENEALRKNVSSSVVDLSSAQNIEEFFNRIKDMSIQDRAKNAKPAIKFSSDISIPDSDIIEAIQGRSGDTIQFIPDEKLTDKENKISGLGKTLNCQVRFFQGSPELRGFHASGTTYLNRNGNLSPQWTFWHETFHWMTRNNNPLFTDLKEAIQKYSILDKKQIDYYRKEIAMGEITDAQGEYIMSDDDILEEMMADKMTDVAGRLGLSKVLSKKDPSLYERFVQFINNVLQKFKRLYLEPIGLNKAQGKLMESKFYQMAADMRDAEGNRIFRKNSGQLELISTRQPLDEETGFAIDDTAIAYSKKNKKSDEDVQSPTSVSSNIIGKFIDDSLADKTKHETLAISKVTQREAHEIFEATGIDVNGYTHCLDSNDIRHIINGHGIGNERQKNQIPLSNEDLQNIPDILNSPDNIKKGTPSRREGFPTICYLKNDLNGISTVVEVVRKKGENLVVKTMWKKNATRLHADQAIDPQYTSESGNSKLSSTITDSIPQQRENIQANQENEHSEKDAFSMSKDSTSIKNFTERAAKKLLEATGLKVKTAKNVTVDTKPKGERLSLSQLTWRSASEVAKAHQTFRIFFRLADKAVALQEKLRNAFAKDMKKVQFYLKKEQDLEQCTAALWQGDAEQKEYSVKDLKEMGLSDNAIHAYKLIRSRLTDAYNLINDARQQVKIRNEVLSETNLAKLKETNFVDVIRSEQQSNGDYLVTYKSAKLWHKTDETIDSETLNNFKKDDNILVAHAVLKSNGLYNVEYFEKTPPLTKRVGYVSHFFHEYMIMEKTKNSETKSGYSYEVIGSGKKLSEAIHKANEIAESKGNEGKEYVIRSKQFNFDEQEQVAAVLGDKEFIQMTKQIADHTDMNLKEAREFLKESGAGVKARHRFFGSMMHRKGAAGFEKDLFWVLNHYFNASSRYVAMEQFKPDAISQFERFFGKYDNDYKDNQLAEYVKDYIHDINGDPTSIESALNVALKGNQLFQNVLGDHFGDRPALQISAGVSGFTAKALLGFFSTASALMNFMQFVNVASKINSYEYAMKGLKKALHPSPLDQLIIDESGALNDINISADAGGYSQRRSYAKSSGRLKGVKSAAQFTTDRVNWLMDKGMFLFSKMDALMRKTAVLAAYYQGVETKGFKIMPGDKVSYKALEYAKDVDRAANFDYGVHDTPNMIRRGSVLTQNMFQFQKYPIKQLEFMMNLAKEGDLKQNAKFWLPFLLIAGLGQFPFLDLFGDLISMFTGMKPKDAARKMLMDFGAKGSVEKALADTAMYGIFSNVGIDISNRAGMANFFTDIKFGGPFAGMVGNVAKQISNGNPIETIKAVSPSVGNMLQAVVGETRTTRHRVGTTYDSNYEKLLHALGFRTIDEAITTDLKDVMYNQRTEAKEDEQDAIDAFIKNPTVENRSRLIELKITPKRIENERRKKSLNNRDRATDSMTKKQKEALKDTLEFAK